MPDTFDPDRFISAQDRVWVNVLRELQVGIKTTHWMWFVFPQIAGLGKSATSVRYALSSKAAATDYLAHPVLGPRLVEAAKLTLDHSNKSAESIFGQIDTMKFRSSMTLFDSVSRSESVFGEALSSFFDGIRDPSTLARL